MKTASLDFTQDTVIVFDDEYYTTSGVLKVMGIGKTTLSKEIKKGMVEVFKHPGGHLFSKSSVLEWIEKRTLRIKKKK